jgi:DNA replication protein DnaC
VNGAAYPALIRCDARRSTAPGTFVIWAPDPAGHPEFPTQDRADYPRYLLRLCELERIDRERRNMERRIRLARFPQTKSFDIFDFAAQPSLNKALVLELIRCEWIDRRQNCIALGPSGTGKTHVALGLGLAACQKGYSVAFTTAAALARTHGST